MPPLPELRFAQISSQSQARYAGDRVSYMEAGSTDGFPLVLLHGIGGNSMHWRFQFAGLADRWWVIAWNPPVAVLAAAVPNTRLVTLDCIGHLPEVEARQKVNTVVREFLLAG